jgi:hypothetical protein
MMAGTFKATDIKAGYHPAGYRIDSNASPMNIYTKWTITADGRWVNPQPVCFDSLPQEGWQKTDRFNWNERSGATEEA